jgi:hypothetical protein
MVRFASGSARKAREIVAVTMNGRFVRGRALPFAGVEARPPEAAKINAPGLLSEPMPPIAVP